MKVHKCAFDWDTQAVMRAAERPINVGLGRPNRHQRSWRGCGVPISLSRRQSETPGFLLVDSTKGRSTATSSRMSSRPRDSVRHESVSQPPPSTLHRLVWPSSSTRIEWDLRMRLLTSRRSTDRLGFSRHSAKLALGSPKQAKIEPIDDDPNATTGCRCFASLSHQQSSA